MWKSLSSIGSTIPEKVDLGCKDRQLNTSLEAKLPSTAAPFCASASAFFYLNLCLGLLKDGLTLVSQIRCFKPGLGLFVEDVDSVWGVSDVTREECCWAGG